MQCCVRTSSYGLADVQNMLSVPSSKEGQLSVFPVLFRAHTVWRMSLARVHVGGFGIPQLVGLADASSARKANYTQHTQVETCKGEASLSQDAT